MRALKPIKSLGLDFISPQLFRQFSSTTNPDVYQLKIRPKTAEVIQDHNQKITKFFLENKGAVLKKFNLKPFWQESVEFARKITDADHDFKEELKHIHQLQPDIVSIPEIPLPPFDLQHFPRRESDLENHEFRKITTPSIMTICCFAHLLGIEPTQPSFIFSQESYDLVNSNQELDWHNDGWQAHPDTMDMYACLMLLGVVGNQNVLTEVITLRRILETLREKGREDLIKALSKNHNISYEDYIQVIAPIIKDEKAIRFASRAAYEMAIGSGNKAALELKQHLEETTPSFSTSIKPGDLLFVENEKCLHKRSIVSDKNDPNTSPKKFQGERLLTRIIEGRPINR